LQKLAGGTFGICEDCDEHIPPRRLMAVPEARLCARCQEFEEKSQSRMRGGTFARAS
jgi:DnaK suppressor protein